MVKSLLLAFPMLLTAPASFAQANLGQAWPSIIQNLQKEGIQKVGDFDLAQFSKDAQQITWKKNTAAAPSVVSGSRTSAYYITEKKEVYISPLPDEALASVSDLELHEALGALGYEDNQYTLSSALRTLLDIKSPELRSELLKQYGQDLFNKPNLLIRPETKKSAFDGGSSVGGGGDIRTLLVKHQVLANILKTSKNISVEFLTMYPQIGFEPIYDKSVDYVPLRYDHRPQAALKKMGPRPRVSIKNGAQELITIYVPVQYWDRKDTRPALLAEIKKKVVGLFPVNQKSGAAQAIPICDKTQTMYFPATDDSQVIAVQKVRGGLIRGCDSMKDYDTTFWAPGLPAEAMPAVAGFRYALCTFGTAQNAEERKFGLPDGQSISQHFSGQLSETSRLSALAQFDGKGVLYQMLFMVYKDQNGKPEFIKKQITSMKDAFITYNYNGLEIKLSCRNK